VRLNSLLNLHGTSDVLTPREVDDLSLAFSDLREHLAQLHRSLMGFRTENDLAIDNKVITIESSLAAQAADGEIQKARSTEH